MKPKTKTEPSEIIAALRANLHLLNELAVRYEVSTNPNRADNPLVTISCPGDVYALLRDEMADLAQEQLRVLLLDTRNHVIGQRVIYQGTVNECSVRPAEVLRPAVVEGVPNIIVAHNHPSRDPSPSPEDTRATRELNQACKMLGVKLLDHVVIGGDHYASIKDLGHIID